MHALTVNSDERVSVSVVFRRPLVSASPLPLALRLTVALLMPLDCT